MSFLTERAIRSAMPLCRLAAPQASRAFATSALLRKTPTESVKDGLKTVDRKVTDNIVLPGLETAASAGSKVKEGAETLVSGKKGKEAREAAQEAAEKAKGAAKDAKDKL